MSLDLGSGNLLQPVPQLIRQSRKSPSLVREIKRRLGLVSDVGVIGPVVVLATLLMTSTLARPGKPEQQT